MKKAAFTRKKTASQKGSVMLEALVSITIFAFGILALISMQAKAIKENSDAKYRADASYFASQLIGSMRVDQANLATYQYRPDEVACTASTVQPSNTVVTEWMDQLSKTLPGVTLSRPKISIDMATSIVNVTICWKSPSEAVAHRYDVIAQIK